MCASLLVMLVTYSSPFEILHFILVDSNHTLFASDSVRVREFFYQANGHQFLTKFCTPYVSLYGI